MGKKRITLVDDSQEKQIAKPQKEEKANFIDSEKFSDSVVAKETAAIEDTEKGIETLNETEKLKDKKTEKKAKPKAAQSRTHVRGKKYKEARMKVDPTHEYELSEAVKLVKETSTSKFPGSVETHFVVLKKGLKGEANLPYLESKSKRVEIASKDTLAKIDSGKIDFDVLIATPAFMTNLVKYAKVLGPKGLMPNPKNGTITDDPEKAVQKFQKESFSFRTEANAPLIHSVIGKTSQKEEELEANLKALIQAIGPKNIKKAVLVSSMGPGIKLAL